jgi:hypothetical protein
MKKFTLFKSLLKSYSYGIDDKIQSFDDTFAEKLNYRYTVAFLFAMAYLVTTKQIHGASTNVTCFVPAHLKKYSAYINEYCFLSVTYYVPFDEKLLPHMRSIESVNKEHNAVKYYQSMQYIIMLIAGCIYLPRLVYRWLIGSCGVDLKALIGTARLINKPKNIDCSEGIVSYVVLNFDFYICKKSSKCSTSKCTGFFKRNYLVKIFFLVKLFYIFNSLLVMKLTSVLLGIHENFFMTFDYKYLKSLFQSYKSENILDTRLQVREVYFPKVIFP